MTDQTYTHIEALSDRSGSMASIMSDVEGGFNAFIAEQAKQPGRCTVSLSQFDDHYEVNYTALPVDQVPPLSIQPRGMTAMLDAIGRSITDLGARLAAMPEDERPGTVIVPIMTDGMENASKEWTYEAVKKLITEQEAKYGWQFLYMGADQDAIEVGAKMGIRQERSLTYGRGSSKAAYAATSGLVTSLRSAAFSGDAAAMDSIGYAEADREASAK